MATTVPLDDSTYVLTPPDLEALRQLWPTMLTGYAKPGAIDDDGNRCFAFTSRDDAIAFGHGWPATRLAFSSAQAAWRVTVPTAPPGLDMRALALRVQALTDHSAVVDNSGGGCATIYVGPWEGDQCLAMIGPGLWRDGQPITCGELFMGADDGGATTPVGVRISTLENTAATIAAAVRHLAMFGRIVP